MKSRRHRPGKKTRQFQPERLKQTVMRLIEAETWDEQQRIVEKHPELLGHQTDALLAQMAKAQGDEDLRQTVLEQRRLLHDCRTKGIPAAFQEQIGYMWRATRSLSPELCGILAQLDKPAEIVDFSQHIVLCRQALEMVDRAAEPELWATLQGELGEVLAPQDMESTPGNLDEAIDHFEQALAVFTQTAFPVDWAVTQSRLGEAYSDRIHGEPAENMERAIHHYGQALSIFTPERFPEDWASNQINLGGAYANRIRGDRAGNLERAIRHFEQALSVFTQAHFPEDWANVQNNLGTTYADRIRGDRAENLEQAIHHFEKALLVYTQEYFPIDWAGTQHNLGGAYEIRIRGEKADNLERAIHHCEQALSVLTLQNDPKRWAMSQNNLGNAYSRRIRGERARNIERAIHHFENALTVYNQECFPMDWAGAHCNLAGAYNDRIHGGRVENIERAIFHCKEALRVWTPLTFPENWAMAQDSLGTIHSERIRGERAKNIETAIHHFENALTVYTQETFPESWATTQNNLGGAYADRVEGNQEENLERAIGCFRRSLSVYTREAFPDKWAMTQANLGEAYRNRIRGGRSESLRRAIHHFENALSVYSKAAFPMDWAKTQHLLGEAYGNRTRDGHPGTLERAINHFQQALSIYTEVAFPEDHCTTQCGLGFLCMTRQRLPEAIAAFRGALAAGEQLYEAAATPEARFAALRELRGVTDALAYALSRNVRNAGHFREAIETLDRNRARWLAEALTLSDDRPTDVPNTVWENFMQKSSQIRALITEAQLPETTPGKRDFLSLSQMLADARQEMVAIIEQIRMHNPAFMPNPEFAMIQETLAGPGQAGVYLLTTMLGSLALIVHAEGIEPVWLDTFNDFLLRQLLGKWVGAYLSRKQDFAAWLDTMDSTLQRLWQDMMEPLGAALRKLHHQDSHQAMQVTLVPSGLLALLPWHAAWTADEKCPTGRHYFMDEFVVSYAPSALSLRHARTVVETGSANKLLSVDEPGPYGGRPLPNAAAEVQAITHFFADPVVLRHAQATRTAVLSALPSADLFHCACHGANDQKSPLDSGLLMAANDWLTMRDLMSLKHSTGRMATLSACETGVVGTDLPDEVMTLPTALLQAGFGGVVASLWSVADISTAMLMEHFYHYWREEGLNPAQALRSAQRWLRDTRNREKAEYFQHFSHDLAMTRMPEDTAVDFFTYVMGHARGQDARVFEHPFWWAAFYLTGL